MKLIIDIPNNVYANLMEYCEHHGIVEAVYFYIYHGIPLEQIRDEIEEGLTDYIIGEQDTPTAKKMFKVMDKALDIIDKYK